jgi:transcriptional regulator GlxA family with amidase domain
MKIGIYVYDQAEVLDFAGPYEVFSTAARVADGVSRCDVFLIGETGHIVTARGGFRVNPDYGFHNCPDLDVLIVAGGVHADEMLKPGVMEWLMQKSKQTPLVASVCTGVFLLAQARLLDGVKVTTHWQDIAELRACFPHLEVAEGVRWVDQGRIITAGGISAGIDMSLHLVRRLFSASLAQKTATQMEYSWSDEG